MDRVRETLQLNFPEWYAAQKSQAPTDQHAVLLDDDLDDDENHHEFTVWSPWVLRPDGLAELFDEFEKNIQDVEIHFELRDGMLRVRCPQEKEGQQTTLVCKILNSIVLSDDRKFVKVIRAEDWNASRLTDEEVQQFEPFCAPRSVARRKFRGKWILSHLPEFENFTVPDLFPGKLLEAIQEVTGTTLIVTHDRSMVWIGADTEREVAIAKKKLTTLTNCWALGRISKDAHFFFPEAGQDWMVAFRYLGHVSSSFLSTFFLDRNYHPTKDYTRLFNRGVGLCALSWNSRTREFLPVPLEEVSGTGSATHQDEPYKAFDQWKYPERSRVPGFMDGLNKRGVNTWVEHLDKSEAESSANQEKSKSASKSGMSSTAGEKAHTESTIGNLAESKGKAIGDDPRLSTSGIASQKSPEGEDSGSSSKHVQSQPATQTQEQSEQPGSSDISRSRAVVPILVNSEVDGPESRSSIPESSEAGYTAAQDVDTASNLSTQEVQDPDTVTGKELVLYRGANRDILSADDTHSVSDTEAPVGLPFIPRSPDDPFLKMYEEERLKNSARRQRLSELNLPLNVVEGETRELHNTMRQKAGSRYIAPESDSKTQHDPVRRTESITPSNPPEQDSGATETFSIQQTHGPELIPGVDLALVDILKPLRAYIGKVSVKAQLGKFSFINVNDSYVLSDPEGGTEHLEPVTMKRSLDSIYSVDNAPWFTPILTTDASDANIIAFLKEADGTRMWKQMTRRAFYVFSCQATIATGRKVDFSVEVDANDFTYSVQLNDQHTTRLFMHCLKRYSDFQLTVSATPNLQQIHETFAKDLVDSLTVTPNPSGPPKLELIVSKGYCVMICAVRTRNVASYGRRSRRPPSIMSNPQEQFTVLEVAEVHDMATVFKKSKRADAFVYTSKPFPGIAKKGQPPMWIEASIQSNVLSSALRKNETLELGDEAAWSPEELRDLGAFDDLVAAATDTVKRIDAVGYWCDNGRAAVALNRQGTYRPLGAHAPPSAARRREVYW